MSLRAESLARRVHLRLAFEHPPVNPSMLIAYAPIEVVSMDWPEELDGVLLLTREKAVIGLNQRHSRVKRHFSFWHEVGHYLLHRGVYNGETPCGTGSGRAGAQEREADAFAASVLMPEHWIRAEIGPSPQGGATRRNRPYSRGTWGEGADVPALARRFMVSHPAMERRLRDLRLR